MVVVEVRGRNVGLEVDEILGSEEVFIKSLGEPLERIPGFSGVTILGDGRPVLILDVVNLM
jgi:two-component system chemotaxis sensor kinase CheA